MKVLWLTSCVLALTLVSKTDSTLSVIAAAIPAGLAAAAPALAAVGGLSALKILKVVGLSKLRNTLNSDDYDDYYPYNNNNVPSHYGPPPPRDGPPIFYLVPRDHYGPHRGKRDIQTNEDLISIPEDMGYFEAVGAYDFDRCALRLVCELAVIPENELAEDERAIMSNFKSPFTPTLAAIRTPKGAYDFASWIGKTSVNVEKCKTIYTRCNWDAKEIMTSFREMEAEEIAQDMKIVSQSI